MVYNARFMFGAVISCEQAALHGSTYSSGGLADAAIKVSLER